MCGIAGKVYLNENKVSGEELKIMADKIAHRGPDDQGIYISGDSKIGIANSRLAIIDLSKNGNQPMSYKNRYFITYNGEVYNFQEERKKLEKKGYRFKSKTDTEVILALYDKYRERCLNHLRGMFAFAIYDDKDKTLFLARDRIGKKPLKYFFNGNVFIFASELKAILSQKEVKKSPDFAAIYDYLTYGFTPPPLTGFSGIKKLEAGTYLFLDLQKKSLEKKTYWQPDFRTKLNLTENEWQNEILKGLEEALKLRLISVVPLGAFLSGGMDSSAMVYFMSKLSAKPVKTFTIGFKVKTFDETKDAENIAGLFKTEHTKLYAEPESVDILPDLIYKMEEPYANSSIIVSFLVNNLAKKFVTVILNGIGGDENFAGYPWLCRFKRDVLLDNFQPILRNIGIPISGFLSQKKGFINWQRLNKFLQKSALPISQRFLSYNFLFGNEEKKSLLSENFKHLAGESESHRYMDDIFAKALVSDLKDAALFADLTWYLPYDLLAKEDIASMSASLEARSPFLDHEFIKLTAQIPFSLK